MPKRKTIRRKTNPRRRKNSKADFKIYHADHGITPAQKKYIKEWLGKNAVQGFSINAIEIPARLGKVPNAMYGPAAGDSPIKEKDVYYDTRGDRTVLDRMISKPVRPWNIVQSIGIRTNDDFEIFTIYGGPLAPQHPDDPRNPDPQGAKKFWGKHALSDQQWLHENPRRRKNALKAKGGRTSRPDAYVFPEGGKWENEFKKSFRDRTFKNGFMSLNAKEQTIFQNKPFNKMLDKSGQSINVAAYGAFLDKAIAESNAALAAKSGSWMKKNLPSLESAKNALPQIKGPKSYLKAVRSDLEDTEKGSKTSLLGKLGRGTVKNRLPGNAYIIRKVVTDHLAKSRPAKGSSSRKDTTIGFRDLFSADNIPSLSEESQSKSKSKSKSRSRSRSKASASESDPLSSSEEAMLSESVEESIAKGEVVGVLDEDQIAVLRVTADNFKDSLDQVQESLSETKELYANMKAQLSSMGLQILPNPSHVRPLSRVGSDRYFPSSYRPRLLSQLNPRGAVKLKVPLRMKATPRRAAEELYVYPKRKSFPIGDLYHARMAIIYVLSSDHSRQRKKVIKTVQANWPDYSWSTFWNAKRKGKKLKTWNQYLK